MTELPTITGDGVVLRPWVPTDAVDLHREIQDAEIVRWLNIELPYARADAEAFIAKTQDQWEHRRAAHFVIADPAANDLVGYLGVLSVEEPMRVVEIVYWVAAPARGKGVGTRSLGAVIPWVEDAIAPDRIELGMIEGNAASAGVAMANGFELTAIIIGGATLDGEPANERIYELDHDGSP